MKSHEFEFVMNNAISRIYDGRNDFSCIALQGAWNELYKEKNLFPRPYEQIRLCLEYEGFYIKKRGELWPYIIFRVIPILGLFVKQRRISMLYKFKRTVLKSGAYVDY